MKLYEETKPESVELIVNTWLHYIRNHADADVKQPLVDVVRRLIQKVVVGPRPGHPPARLQVHGRIASITQKGPCISARASDFFNGLVAGA